MLGLTFQGCWVEHNIFSLNFYENRLIRHTCFQATTLFTESVTFWLLQATHLFKGRSKSTLESRNIQIMPLTVKNRNKAAYVQLSYIFSYRNLAKLS
jgi:hypothetical protein